MKPSRPTNAVWLLGIISGILGIVGHFASIQFVSLYSFWFLLVGFVLLALGTTFKGI